MKAIATAAAIASIATPAMLGLSSFELLSTPASCSKLGVVCVLGFAAGRVGVAGVLAAATLGLAAGFTGFAGAAGVAGATGLAGAAGISNVFGGVESWGVGVSGVSLMVL